jgi:biotin carboxylase
LFLGASASQLPAIRYAREAGHELVTVDARADAPGHRLADVAEQVDFADVDRVVEVARACRVEGVLAVCSDRAVLPAARTAAALGLPGIGSEVARAMTDKGCMRARLAAAGVRQPRHLILDGTVAQPDGSLRLPAVLKPVDSGGQRGLYLIEQLADLERCLDETLAVSVSRRAILEEYVEGTELNGMVVVHAGEPRLLTLSDRLRPQGRGFGVGWIHSYPSALPPEALARARDLAFAAIRALGLHDGIAFPQLLVDAQGEPWLVEVAARIAAGQMADLVSFATGVNLFAIAIAQALGRPVPDALLTPRFQRPVTIRFLTAQPGVLPVGTVTKIDGLDQVRRAPGVLAADLYFDLGHQIRPVQVDADRNGYVVTTADDPASALELADAAAAHLVVHTR